MSLSGLAVVYARVANELQSQISRQLGKAGDIVTPLVKLKVLSTRRKENRLG